MSSMISYSFCRVCDALRFQLVILSTYHVASSSCSILRFQVVCIIFKCPYFLIIIFCTCSKYDFILLGIMTEMSCTYRKRKPHLIFFFFKEHSFIIFFIFLCRHYNEIRMQSLDSRALLLVCLSALRWNLPVVKMCFRNSVFSAYDLELLSRSYLYSGLQYLKGKLKERWAGTLYKGV